MGKNWLCQPFRVLHNSVDRRYEGDFWSHVSVSRVTILVVHCQDNRIVSLCISSKVKNKGTLFFRFFFSSSQVRGPIPTIKLVTLNDSYYVSNWCRKSFRTGVIGVQISCDLVKYICFTDTLLYIGTCIKWPM